MNFKPNTVQVPRAIVKGVESKAFHQYDVYYAALRMMYPKQDPAAIAEKFGIQYPDKVDRFFAAEQKESSNGTGGQQNYPEAPPAPEGFLENLQEDINQRGNFERELRPNVANAIYEAAGGDEDLVYKAAALMEDYHNNGSEVKSPGAVILTTLKKRSPDKIEEDFQRIQSGGTAVGNRERRMTRAMERTEEYVRSGAATPEPDPNFFGNEGETDE